MWRVLFWRSTLALTSILVFMATFTASVLADSHPMTGGGGQSAGQGAAQGAAQGAGQTVTAVPSTGVGTMSEHVSGVLLLSLVAVAVLMAVLSLVTARQQRA